MSGFGNAFPAFDPDARDASRILSLRKNYSRILDGALDFLPDSLAEAHYQKTKRNCIPATGFGRLFVVYYRQTSGDDWSVVNRLEPYPGRDSALSKSIMPAHHV